MDDSTLIVKSLLDHVKDQGGTWVPFQVDEPEEFQRVARWLHSGAQSPYRSQYGGPREAFAIEWYAEGEGWGARVEYRVASGGRGRIKYRPPRPTRTEERS